MTRTDLPDYQDDSHQSLLEKFLFPVRSINRNRMASGISNKTILITGASYGIGALLAKIISDFEVRLILVARTAEKLEELKQDCCNKPSFVMIYNIDLREEAEINSLLQKFAADKIEIDIFINNAGKSINRGLTDSMGRYEDVRRCSATNYTGPVQLLLGILPGLINRKGHIINVSAQNVLLPPTAGWSAYQSSKIALDQWLRCMEPEFHLRSVMVSSVYLPLVRTRMSMVNHKNHNRPAMSKEKAARSILNCIIHKKRKYLPWWTGMLLFLHRLFPNLWYRLQLRFLKSKN